MTGSPMEDRGYGGAAWSDSLELPAAPRSGKSFRDLPPAQQFHALVLRLKGYPITVICDELRRRRHVRLVPPEVAAELEAAMEAARAWNHRPLPAGLAMLFFEKLPDRFRGKDAGPVWTAMGIAPDGMRNILGFWPERGGAGFWLDLQRDLKRRGLRQAGIVIPDRGGPLLPAVAATHPGAHVVLSPAHALAPALAGLPQTVSFSLRRSLDAVALAETPPRVQAVLRLAERQGAAPLALDALGLAAMQCFLDLPAALRAFLLRTSVTTVIREKLQRNAEGTPLDGDGETRALLLASRLRGLDNGWKVGLGRWRAIHDCLAGIRPRRSGDQRLNAQAVRHADQLHQG